MIGKIVMRKMMTRDEFRDWRVEELKLVDGGVSRHEMRGWRSLGMATRQDESGWVYVIIDDYDVDTYKRLLKKGFEEVPWYLW